MKTEIEFLENQEEYLTNLVKEGIRGNHFLRNIRKIQERIKELKFEPCRKKIRISLDEDGHCGDNYYNRIVLCVDCERTKDALGDKSE